MKNENQTLCCGSDINEQFSTCRDCGEHAVIADEGPLSQLLIDRENSIVFATTRDGLVDQRNECLAELFAVASLPGQIQTQVELALNARLKTLSSLIDAACQSEPYGLRRAA